tara:strand:- start:3124 stop:4038 length:915 start_codon:yes stop_codon:yes gene_type:complete
MRIVSIGECMAELSSRKDSGYNLNFAGDTANTSIYLSRLGIKTAYLTSIGNDAISKNLLNFLKKEKIVTNYIFKNSKKTIGVYLIKNNKRGEREFFYWRSDSAAKSLFENININKYYKIFKNYDAVYFSGITLSIYNSKNLNNLYLFIKKLKNNDTKIYFDLNVRLKNWKSVNYAKQVIKKFSLLSDIIFISKEDLNYLKFLNIKYFINNYSNNDSIILFRAGSGSIKIYKNNYISKYKLKFLKNVKDTTGSGDAFNASFIYHLLKNKSEKNCVSLAHKLGKSVALTKGAIMSKKEFNNINYDR